MIPSPPTPPAPGSPEAYQQGCRCPILDNAHGAGAYKREGVPQFWINADCPLHGGKQEEADGD